jgi:choline dehydrogenase-like flavoprotein
VHGQAGIDPTEPRRSGDYPFPPMPSDSYMSELAESFRKQGLHPFPLPVGLDYRPGGSCIRCRTCDAFPCFVHAKADAETCAIRPALALPNVSLMTNAYVRRIVTGADPRKVRGVEIERNGMIEEVEAGIVVVACGAVNSAALLLRSGIANSSGQVGRNYMVHNNTVLVAVHPTKINPTVFQKSISINDFYFGGPDFPYPMGNLQPVGKIQPPMLAGALPRLPEWALGAIADRSTDWWVMSEDLPDPENRVVLSNDGKIEIHWRPNNMIAHRQLIKEAKRIFHEAGYPLVVTKTMGIETNSHQVGTLRFGDDPATSVLDEWGRAHDFDNLYAVDGSFFPSSSAVNPALTIIAQALRVADRLQGAA